MAITVAIVEDNADICEELAEIIAKESDFSCVCVCRNLQTALIKIPSIAPNVIIMDILLPDGNGIDCTRRLRPMLPHTHILMCTTYENRELITQALAAGACGYLLKRNAPETLLHAIHEVMQGRIYSG